MQEASGDRTGQLIGGKYSIESLIARGGMGLVYQARHSGTGRTVAVKLLRPELAARPDLVRRVSTEARLAVEASHPNVVEVLDAGADDAGIPFVVLERLYGRPLEAFIDAPVALAPAVHALLPIVNALVSLHQAGIVHRDIKPSNIFLSRGRDGRVTPKLLDFGIAKALFATGMTLSGAALGTPAYMAPEQALGAGDAGAATDIWSFAVVFVRCLTGQLPFDAPPQRRVASLRAGLQPVNLELVPAPLGRVLSRALRFDPGERFANMAEFRGELLAALHEIEPGRPWPTPDTVSYGAEESELSTWLGTSAFDEATHTDEWGHHRRPAGVDTKTLAAVQTAASLSAAPRRSARGRHLGVTLLTLSALGIFIGAGRLTLRDNERSPERPTTSETHARPLALQPVTAATAQGTLDPLPAPVPDAQADPVPASEEAGPSPSAAARRTSAVAASANTSSQRPPPPKEARGAGSEPARDSPVPKAAFGANRARIIE